MAEKRQCFVPCKDSNQSYAHVYEIYSDQPIIALKFDLANGKKYKVSCLHANRTCTDAPTCSKSAFCDSPRRETVTETAAQVKNSGALRRASLDKWSDSIINSPWAKSPKTSFQEIPGVLKSSTIDNNSAGTRRRSSVDDWNESIVNSPWAKSPRNSAPEPKATRPKSVTERRNFEL